MDFTVRLPRETYLAHLELGRRNPDSLQNWRLQIIVVPIRTLFLVKFASFNNHWRHSFIIDIFCVSRKLTCRHILLPLKLLLHLSSVLNRFMVVVLVTRICSYSPRTKLVSPLMSLGRLLIPWGHLKPRGRKTLLKKERLIVLCSARCRGSCGIRLVESLLRKVFSKRLFFTEERAGVMHTRLRHVRTRVRVLL